MILSISRSCSFFSCSDYGLDHSSIILFASCFSLSLARSPELITNDSLGRPRFGVLLLLWRLASEEERIIRGAAPTLRGVALGTWHIEAYVENY